MFLKGLPWIMQNSAEILLGLDQDRIKYLAQ